MELQTLSKDSLIEVHRKLFGNVGDTGRTSKAQYIERIIGAEPEKVAAAIAEVATNGNGNGHGHAQHNGNGSNGNGMTPEAGAAELLRIVQSLAGGAVNEEKVRAIVDDAIAAAVQNLPARETKIVVTPLGEVKVEEHTHPAFSEIAQAVGAGLNVLLVGPAGCGKTHTMRQIGTAFKARRTAIFSGSAGASESQLTGWLLPVLEGGRFGYVESAFVDIYANGGLAGLDELDAYDPNMLLTANAALANGHLFIPHRYEQPEVTRHPEARIIASANTYGTGADMIYAGRNQLDAATLDRFYCIPMDYDRDYEAQLAPGEVCEWVWGIRQKIAELKLRRVISTRTIQKSAALLKAGAKLKNIKARLLAGWTRDELAKVGE